ncbi:Methyltransferase domain-containing protein [Agreia pratensis]|uniref:Methyltransferase domain-containing protein n=1 Tax=Agreia pratensis TaxID=150121 RepID=A0A1X7J9F4_9MICO|nr:Methyltransferase domain-containing protein [Agreia pratensis]
MHFIDWLNRFNATHPWSHNDFYGPWIVRQVRSRGARKVLDVGCGTGNLVARLIPWADSITGLEPHTATARIAAERFASNEAVEIRPEPFEQRDPGDRFEAITLVAVLHHLPLQASMKGLASALDSGGRLVIVGCYRESTRADRLVSFGALLLNPMMGLIKTLRDTPADREGMTAPTAPARESLAEIAAEAALFLPGARIRRRLFWRYSLVYDAPRRGALS